MRKWLFLMGAIACEVTGALSMKGAMEAPWLYALTAAGYLGAFAFLYLSLSGGMKLGVGYGVWAATGIAATAVMSRVVFAEPITPLMGIGIVAVMAGVLLVEIGSQRARPQDEVPA